MAKTAVADIIVPTEFEKYAIERTAELSAFGQCGIVEHAPEFDELAAGGGRTVEMPFWKDLTATRQILSDSGSLTGNKITAGKDIARTADMFPSANAPKSCLSKSVDGGMG